MVTKPARQAGAAGGAGRAAARATVLPWLLRRVAQRFRTETASALAAAGLGDLPQPGVWAVMAIAGGANEPGQLVDRMGVSKQAVSKLVDRLVAVDVVQRVPVHADRRRTGLALTARGRQAVRTIGAAVRSTERAMASELGPEQFALLVGLLGQLAGEDR